MALANLFFAFLRIGLFAIGGAYSFLPLIEKEVIEKYGWLTKEEFLEILGIVRIVPGAISIKYATYIGYKVAGVPGAIVANLANLIPPVIIVIFASGLYAKYNSLASVKGALNAVQLAVFAMIIAVAFQLINPTQLLQLRNLLIIIICFLLFVFTKIHPALIIIGVGIVGVFLK